MFLFGDINTSSLVDSDVEIRMILKLIDGDHLQSTATRMHRVNTSHYCCLVDYFYLNSEMIISLTACVAVIDPGWWYPYSDTLRLDTFTIWAYVGFL